MDQQGRPVIPTVATFYTYLHEQQRAHSVADYRIDRTRVIENVVEKAARRTTIKNDQLSVKAYDVYAVFQSKQQQQRLGGSVGSGTSNHNNLSDESLLSSTTASICSIEVRESDRNEHCANFASTRFPDEKPKRKSGFESRQTFREQNEQICTRVPKTDSSIPATKRNCLVDLVKGEHAVVQRNLLEKLSTFSDARNRLV